MYIIKTYADWVENYDSAEYDFSGWEPLSFFEDIEEVLRLLELHKIPGDWTATEHYEPGERISRSADQILQIRSGHKLGARELFSIAFRDGQANTMALEAGCHFVYLGGRMSADLLEKIMDFRQATFTHNQDPAIRIKVYQWTAKMHCYDTDWVVVRSFKSKYAMFKIADVIALLPIVCGQGM